MQLTGIPVEAHGVPDNEYQFNRPQNMCNRRGFEHSYDMDTWFRPVQYPLLRGSDHQGMLFGEAVPGQAQAQGLSEHRVVHVDPNNYQAYVNSFMNGVNTQDSYFHDQ